LSHRRPWTALAVLLILGVVVTGCLIEGPAKPPEFYSWVKIQPGDRFSGGPMVAAPEGYIYQLWVANIAFEGQGGGLTDFAPLVRFHWDPENYVALDEDGNPMRLTVDNGMDFGINVFEWNALMVTIEPEDGPNPFGLGPLVLFSDTLGSNQIRELVSPLQAFANFGFPEPAFAQYTFVSQSNKKGNPGAHWRDGSEGEGIWFCIPEVEDRQINETDVYQAHQKVVFYPGNIAIPYTVWIYTDHPESSFSDFGLAFQNQEVDLIYIDGVARHDTIIIASPPDTIIKRGPQVPLGQNHMTINGESVYRYVAENGSVCDLYIDKPWLTHCNSDPFPALLFNGDDHVIVDGDTVGIVYFSEDSTDTCILHWDDPRLDQCDDVGAYYNRIFDDFGPSSRRFITINGDTILSPTLPFLPPSRLFLFDYEAWVIFTPESGIPPLSLGRFLIDEQIFLVVTDTTDDNNTYTFTDSRFDRNFHFPGEDFVNDMSRHHASLSSPLNVINDDRALKIWVTLEPVEPLDWAPGQPYEQMIVYSDWIPRDEFFMDGSETASPDSLSPVTRTMTYRDLNPGTNPLTSLNEGHRWPSMRVYVSNEGP